MLTAVHFLNDGSSFFKVYSVIIIKDIYGRNSNCLIDCGYFDNINRYLGDTVGKKVSFEKLSEKITEGKSHIRTKIYHSNPYKFSESQEEIDKYRNHNNFSMQ